MAVTDSDRLLAAGAEIRLEDGSSHRVQFGMRGLKMLEDNFGSLNKIGEIMGDQNQAKIGPLVEILAAGLWRDGISVDQLYDLLHLAKLPE